MQEIYAALMLHESGKPVEEGSVKKVLESVGASVDDSKIKALVVALQGVNIDEALKEAVSFAAQPAANAAPSEKKEEKKSEEDEAKAAESASAGLSSLFG